LEGTRMSPTKTVANAAPLPSCSVGDVLNLNVHFQLFVRLSALRARGASLARRHSPQFLHALRTVSNHGVGEQAPL
jgi:hypothetical protein